jgi:Tol biopolymer transport system component
VQSKTEKAVWSNVTEFGNVGVKGISDDGTRVLLGSAYESEPTGGNLSVLNVSTGAVTMVTDIKEEQKAPNSGSWDGNGVMAAFAASAPLVKGDTNRALDVYLASTAKSNSVPMLRISALGSKQGNYSSGQPDISRNGKFVAFISRADNLRQNDANYVKDLYVYSLNRGTLSSFVAGNEDIDAPTVNDSGAVVAFVSSASNITPNDTVGTKDIFVGVPSPLRPGSVGGVR